MNTFVTIATFMFPSELVVAKTKLESEGIECRVLDELSVQSHNFLSNAIGGVKLQVQRSEYEKAYSILIQGDLISEEKSSKLNYLERKLSNPEVYRKFKISLIGIISLMFLILVASIIYLYVNKPSDYERLIGERWCLDHVVYENEIFYPYTIPEEVKIRFLGQCDEFIIFDSTGIVQFPGFNTASFNHNWKLTNDQITISEIDTLESVFYGTYNYEMSKNTLVMISDSLEIVCLKSRNGQ